MQALNVGQTLTDTFTVTTVGDTQQLVTITINGRNDAAVISGDFIGPVVEAGGVDNRTPGTPTATGDLNSTDVDGNNPSDAWIAVGTTASTKGYGTYTLTDAGVWTYTLDNSNADVQARNVGQILSDTFTVTTVDGTSKVVIIIISGTNDAAVITGETTGDGGRGRRCCQRNAGHADRYRRPQFHRRRQSERCLGGGQLPDRKHLRHVHAHRRRAVDLHAGRQQCGRAGAQCGRVR